MILCRHKLLFLVYIFAFTAQIAGGAELPTEVIDCRALTSAVARLDCYDQAIDAHTASPSQAAKRRTAENPAPAEPATATAITESEPRLSQQNLFGKGETEMRKSVRETTGAAEIDRIEASVAEVRKTKSGKAVITFDNGQVWMQTDSSRARLAASDEVTIRRRSFGSYMLHNKKTAIRVKRID